MKTLISALAISFLFAVALVFAVIWHAAAFDSSEIASETIPITRLDSDRSRCNSRSAVVEAAPVRIPGSIQPLKWNARLKRKLENGRH